MFFILIDGEYYRELEDALFGVTFDVERNVKDFAGRLGMDYTGLPTRAYEMKLVAVDDSGSPVWIHTFSDVSFYPRGEEVSFTARTMEYFGDRPKFVD